VPKRVIFGARDPQFSPAAAAQAAARIGALPPTTVPGGHLTMIASPARLAAAISAAISSIHGP
jgi:pimeloyl-ACP methyl ester carboxylesterase